MDIQIPTTPEKQPRNIYITPPHSSQQNMNYCSPVANSGNCETPPRKKVLFQTPKKTPCKFQGSVAKDMNFESALKPKQNPESKKQRRSAYKMRQDSPMKFNQCDEIETSSFKLTRLEQDYSLVHYLGSGHFSQVGLYRSRLSGELFAIKTATANRMSVNQVQALGSIWVLSGQCANVIRYYHSWIEEGELYLVMEYCQENLQKTITNYRVSGNPMPEKTIVNYIRAALLGLASIHKQGILHLDVKPENLLFKGNILKIADFGLSRAAQIRSGDIEEGDSRYLAKEVLNLEPMVDLTKADIFSLAMTTYEMLTLETLPNNGAQWMKIREQGIQVKDRMELTGYSQRLLSVVEWMGAAKWSDRPSAAQILQHPLFKQPNRAMNLFSNGKSSKKRQESSL